MNDGRRMAEGGWNGGMRSYTVDALILCSIVSSTEPIRRTDHWTVCRIVGSNQFNSIQFKKYLLF